MEIKELHDGMIEFSQGLIPKSCKIKYPDKVKNSRYKDKYYSIPSITSMRLKESHLKRLDYTFTRESILITIRIELLEETVSDDASNTPIKLGGFKEDNVEVTYKKKKWSIVREELGEFDSSIHLYCERMG